MKTEPEQSPVKPRRIFLNEVEETRRFWEFARTGHYPDEPIKPKPVSQETHEQD